MSAPEQWDNGVTLTSLIDLVRAAQGKKPLSELKYPKKWKAYEKARSLIGLHLPAGSIKYQKFQTWPDSGATFAPDGFWYVGGPLLPNEQAPPLFSVK